MSEPGHLYRYCLVAVEIVDRLVSPRQPTERRSRERVVTSVHNRSTRCVCTDHSQVVRRVVVVERDHLVELVLEIHETLENPRSLLERECRAIACSRRTQRWSRRGCPTSASDGRQVGAAAAVAPLVDEVVLRWPAICGSARGRMGASSAGTRCRAPRRGQLRDHRAASRLTSITGSRAPLPAASHSTCSTCHSSRSSTSGAGPGAASSFERLARRLQALMAYSLCRSKSSWRSGFGVVLAAGTELRKGLAKLERHHLGAVVEVGDQPETIANKVSVAGRLLGEHHEHRVDVLELLPAPLLARRDGLASVR